MSMDGISLYVTVQELQLLIAGKIDKVQQPEKDMLLFTVRAGGSTYRLLCCSHAENGRVQLTRKSYENPDSAPAFCMLLRRRLVGGRIVAIRQHDGLERVLCIDVATRDEMMDDVTMSFVIELMGKHANMLLLDGSGVIVDCTRRISVSDSAARVLLPGFPYEPAPLQDKRNIFGAKADELMEVFSQPDPARALCSGYAGISRQSANAMISAAPEASAFQKLMAGLAAGGCEPSLTGQGVLPFHPLDSYTPYSSMSEAYDAYYAARDRQARMQRHSSALRRVSEQALKRARNRQSVYFDALTGEAAGNRNRQCGEWILQNLGDIRPGDTRVVVMNYETDPPSREVVELEARLSAKENAQRYFKLYKKSKAARAYALQQMDAVHTEIDYLEGQLQNIANADTIAELDEIRDELIRERYIHPDKKPAKKPARTVSLPLSFRSSEGILIRVGKNNRQNDALTLKDARAGNYFLHAKSIPGSHVIIDYDGAPPAQTLREAAMLAAYFSGARSSASVPVDYTERRFVKKPSGARPGLVVYSTNQTIYVTPSDSLVERLRV